MTAASPVAKIKALADRTPLIRASDAVKAGVSRTALIRMTRSGEVERVGRGLYRLKTGESYSHPDLVEAAIRVPKSVIVLLSALNFHGLGTQTAWKVWLQLPANFPAPRLNHPPLQVIRSRKREARATVARRILNQLSATHASRAKPRNAKPSIQLIRPSPARITPSTAMPQPRRVSMP